MGTAQKFILGAAGLIVTILLIYAGLSIFNRSKAMADGVAEGQDKSLKESQEYGIMKYDGYTVNGSTAINYIKTVVTDYEVEARIKKGANPIGYIQYTSDFTKMRDVTDVSCYINPLKEYKCTVVRGANDIFSYVEIEEQ